MSAQLMALALATSPFLFGLLVGFAAVLVGIRRWFHTGSAVPTGDIVSLARRIGVRVVGGAALITLGGAYWLAHVLASVPVAQVMQQALIGLPLGFAAGIHHRMRADR